MSGAEKNDPLHPPRNRIIIDEEDNPNNINGESNGERPRKRKVESILAPNSNVNKHHLDEIFAKMKEKDFDPSPDILEGLKKTKYEENGSESSTMLHYKAIKDLIMKRIKNSFLKEKDLDPSPNILKRLKKTIHQLFRFFIFNGSDESTPSGRKFITVKYGVNTRKVGIDGTNETIKEVIKSVFKLRTKRRFWLEDEKHVACPLGRAMKPGNYTLCVDRGIFIKVRFFDDDLVPVYTETVFFHTEEDYKSFLIKRQWRYLEECDGIHKVAYHMDDLQDGVLYRGVKM